jgi:hypothetical protein
VLGEVDRCGWLGVGLSRGELAVGTVRAILQGSISRRTGIMLIWPGQRQINIG